jgi:hypothetical protein
MSNLSNILLEGLILYRIEVLIKTEASENQVYIYNEIRGLKGVVVVTVVQNDFLRSKTTDRHSYSLLKMKFLSPSDPREAIKNIKLDALMHNKIKGLVQFIPRYNTIDKVGQY